MKVAKPSTTAPIPLDVIMGMDFMLRFWAKVDRSGECWIWQGSKDRQGYGRIKSPGTRVNLKAHRIAYAMVHKRDPGDDLVLHGCDNPSCCNPLHLSAGTHSDNMSEMYAHGRRWSRMPLADGYTMTAIRP